MERPVILLVEDNPDDAELTLRAFAEHRVANEVVVARDGQEALDVLLGPGGMAERNALPELVLLDLRLPKVHGLDVLRQIRADARTALIPITILTSSDEEDDLVQSYRRGANSYVRKPVDFDEFTAAVGSLGIYWLLLNRAVTVPVTAPES